MVNKNKSGKEELKAHDYKEWKEGGVYEGGEGEAQRSETEKPRWERASRSR
jgi:hypothetical protein